MKLFFIPGLGFDCRIFDKLQLPGFEKHYLNYLEPEKKESLERYVKRMEELESIAREFSGVQQAFAIQAGREVRVIASSKDTDDKKAAKICRDIAQAFEQKLSYPGEIKVTVVRESRFIELAK